MIKKLVLLLKAAEDAIFMRSQELNGKRTKEREAMDRAVVILRELQVRKLNFPPWESEEQGRGPILTQKALPMNEQHQTVGENLQNKLRKNKIPRS